MSTDVTTAAAITPASEGPIKPVLRLALRIVLGRKKTVAAALVLSIAVAAGGAVVLTRRTYTSTGTLIYTGLPTSGEAQKDLYAAPDLKTLVGLMKSPSLLMKLRDELGEPAPVKLLERCVTASVPTGTRNLTVQATWGDEEKANLLVDRAMALFADAVARLRKEKVDSVLQDYEANLRAVRERVARAEAEWRRFKAEEGLLDPRQDFQKTREQIVNLETDLARARREEANVLAQIKSMEEHIASLKNEQTRQQEESRKYEAAEESVADSRRRQDRLKELIEEERTLVAVQAELSAKKREFDRVAGLFRERLVTRDEYERLQAEMQVLAAKIKENDKIKALKEEQQRIDKVVVPAGQKKSLGSPIIQQTLFRKLELDLQLISIRGEVAQLEQGVAQRKERLDHILKAQPKADALTKAIEAAEAERARAEAEMGMLRQLGSLQAREFTVAQPAVPAANPVSSNRKTLFLAALGAALGLAGAGLVGLELWSGRRGGADVARALGLPVLASLRTPGPGAPGSGAAGGDVRLLALRLRQLVANAGAVVLLGGVEAGPVPVGAVAALARTLARRDERVVLLDAGHADGGEPLEALVDPAARPGTSAFGLADYLTYECDGLEELALPTAEPGVDVILRGRAVPPDDAAGTHRMRELIAALRATYTLVLVIAPPVTAGADLPLLAAHADGIVLHVPGELKPARSLRDHVESLRHQNTPLLGAVLAGVA